MALSAALVFPSNVISNQKTVAILTVTNTGSDAVNVTGIQGIVENGGASYSPAYEFPIGASVQVAGSGGTRSFPLSFIFYAPQIDGTPAGIDAVYTCFANVYASDGSVFSPVPQTVAVGSFEEDPSQNGGELDFQNGYNAANITILFP